METKGEYIQILDQESDQNGDQVISISGYTFTITPMKTYVATCIYHNLEQEVGQNPEEEEHRPKPELETFVNLIKFFDNGAEWLTDKKAKEQIINITGIDPGNLESFNAIFGSVGFKLELSKEQYTKKNRPRRHKTTENF